MNYHLNNNKKKENGKMSGPYEHDDDQTVDDFCGEVLERASEADSLEEALGDFAGSDEIDD
jgi:hypothetical protein